MSYDNYTQKEQKLKSLDKYLERIKTQKKSPSKEYLDEIILNHQLNIPFENADPYFLKKDVSLDIDDLYDKIIERKRGGYCFELNGLFVVLLQELGFEAYSVPCRVVPGEVDLTKQLLHRGNMVMLDGKQYFCDIGFGGAMAPGGVEVVEDVKQNINGEIYWVEKVKPYWWILRRESRGKSDFFAKTEEESGIAKNVILFCEAPWEPDDFNAPNSICGVGENAGFRKRINMSLRKPDGYISMSAEKFVRMKDGVKEEELLDAEDTEHLKEILKNEFGIVF